jgi:outer membrane protein, heavy metal efflux system
MKTRVLGLIAVFSSLYFPLSVYAEDATRDGQGMLGDKWLIAAGPIMRPAGSGMPNITPTAPSNSQPPPLLQAPGQTLAPAQSPQGSQQTELFPLAPRPAEQPTTELPSGQSGAQPGAPYVAPLNMGTIEYNENLAPVSNQKGLSLVQALNESLVNGPRAAAIRAQFGIARANYAAASEQPNPILLFDRGMAAEQVNRFGPVLTADPIWKIVFRFLIAKRLVAQTKLDLLTQLWALRTSVRKAFVELIIARETQKTLAELYQLACNLSTVSEKRFKAGDVAELDVYRARLATNQAAIDAGVGLKRISRANQALNVLMGRPTESGIDVAALPEYISGEPNVKLRLERSDILPDYEKPVPPLNEFVDIAMQNRLELKSLAMQLKVNAANLKGAIGNVVPDPSIALGKSTAGNPGIQQPVGPKLTAVFFTVNAEMPMSNFNQGQIWQFKATQNQLKYQVLSQRNQVLADVSSAYNNLIAARKKIRVYQTKLLADSAEVAHLARRSYEVGQSDITATLQAQQANIQVRSSYLDAINAYASAFADLEFAIGKPLQ